MRPVVTAREMRAIDAEATPSVEHLIQRAGWAVARAALELLDGSYGRVVTILAGRGNNGEDGRVAGRLLGRRGVGVSIVDIGRSTWSGHVDSRTDLVIDAAFGTGFGGELALPPLPPGVPVLAVDLPSGLDADTGVPAEGTLRALATVTFAAPKPGHLLNRGPEFCGALRIADIGLDCSRATIAEMQLDDLAAWPRRSGNAHKWRSAVWLVAGSSGMGGAANLAALGAFRAGAGYVTATSAGWSGRPVEAVAVPFDSVDPTKHRALVVGPGLASPDLAIRALATPLPAVVDAGALDAFVPRSAPTILTPHDGEFERLTGRPPGRDRIEAVRFAANNFGAVVLLKGPTTVIASPTGETRLVTSGDARLATAGTGDVLSGVIGSGLALGLEPLEAASLGALLHASAATSSAAPISGFMASDLPPLLAKTLDMHRSSDERP